MLEKRRVGLGPKPEPYEPFVGDDGRQVGPCFPLEPEAILGLGRFEVKDDALAGLSR